MSIEKMNNPVSNNIKRILNEKGLKQVFLAEKLNETPASISNMLQNKKIIKSDDIQKIAYILNIPIDELFKTE